jgi:hypothetical protein
MFVDCSLRLFLSISTEFACSYPLAASEDLCALVLALDFGAWAICLKSLDSVKTIEYGQTLHQNHLIQSEHLSPEGDE